MLFQSQMLSSTDQDQREMARDEVMSFRHECIRKCQTITSSYPLRWPRPSGVHRTLQILFGHHSGHAFQWPRLEGGKKTAVLKRAGACRTRQDGFPPAKTSG